MIDYREDAKWTVYVHIVPKELNGYDWDKYYVGITGQTLSRRWRNGKGYKDSYFAKAIKKYGWDNIQHEIIATNLTHDEACDMEKILIKKLESKNKYHGYNCTNGGEGMEGFHHSEETKRKISAKVSGENSPMYGRKQSAESIAKRLMHINFKGENNPMYGKHHSDETKEKIRQTKINNKLDIYYNSDEVYQFDKQGIFIQKFKSHRDASKSLGVNEGNISSAVHNERQYAYGFIWRSANDVEFKKGTYIPLNLRVSKRKIPSRIFQFSKTGEFIQQYETYKSIVQLTNYKKSTILSACNGNTPHGYGYIWRYEKDVIEKDDSFFIVDFQYIL